MGPRWPCARPTRWVCNEKRVVDDAGLTGVQSLFARVPLETPELVRWVEAVADRLGVPPGDAMPWEPRAHRSR